jgi:hypothetical protein
MDGTVDESNVNQVEMTSHHMFTDDEPEGIIMKEGGDDNEA